MANFVQELGEAIATAITSGSSYFTGMGGLNAEYGDQPKDYNIKTGRAHVRSEGVEHIQQYDGSAISTFRYSITVAFVDVRAANEGLGVLQQGLHNVFAHRGNAVLNTHLTDSASNRLGGSGICTLSPEIAPMDALTNKDFPRLVARCEITLGHKSPLT